MRILVVGDYISDIYTFGTATRICPEAPVPVISYKGNYDTHSAGGAGLVYGQLKELGADVQDLYGSYSTKHRIFADKHLVCRLDCDSHDVSPLKLDSENLSEVDAIVVSDYGKGAMTEGLAHTLTAAGKPLFVDAKHHWEWFMKEGAFVWLFPNEHECSHFSDLLLETCDHIIQKRGANGCAIGTLKIPATVSEVVDTTGAGDIFMASFVYAWSIQLPAEDCLRFANILAGESCRHLGTYVVPRQFALEVLGTLRPSQESPQPVPDCSPGSMMSAFQQLAQSGQLPASDFPEYDSPLEDLPLVRAMTTAERENFVASQTAPESPSVPTAPTGTPIPSDQESSDEQDRRLR